MVNIMIEFHHRNSMVVGNLNEQLFQILTDVISDNLLAIFRHQNEMIVQRID